MNVEELINSLKDLDQSLDVKARVKINGEDCDFTIASADFDEDNLEVIIVTD